ncbi:UDP-3-O-acyl-N-acetylglucosamine deacetylase [Rhodovulum sp. DZ06]|uniref:UDP-3-O-acyl-N-acetylglucosamine deacetylase n=1 Tax=Rhodovulum sp. DZ06 TaxID=3425126 RepID=UPI003D332083
MQTTVRGALTFDGIGLHSGRPARLRVLPASGEYGIWFKRMDVVGADPMVPAAWDRVTDTRLCTLVSNADGVTVSTVEHLMAALAACGVDNALIEIDGPEIPIMDGSSVEFVRAIRARGLRDVAGEARRIRILKTVEVADGDRVARLEPTGGDSLEIDFVIAFDDAAIGVQSERLDIAGRAFDRELMDCRTFCRAAEVEALRKMGLAQGGSLENAVVVDGDKVLNPEGLRRPDEFVRHKMLDAVGDLALAGAPILGRYVGRKAGHEMNNKILRALFARPDAWRFEVEQRVAPAAVAGA